MSCAGCGNRVYPAERVGAVGRDWHRTCLKCSKCSNRISPGQQLEGQGKLYCKRCYEEDHVDAETRAIVNDSIKCTGSKSTHT